MARYLILSFDDNEDAELYTRQWHDEELMSGDDPTFRVQALIAKPTVFCSGMCHQAGKRVRGFFRGKKWGWWVCGECGKPTHLWGESFRAVISHGRDLLAEVLSDQEEDVVTATNPQPAYQIGNEEKRHIWTPDMYKEGHPPKEPEPTQDEVIQGMAKQMSTKMSIPVEKAEEALRAAYGLSSEPSEPVPPIAETTGSVVAVAVSDTAVKWVPAPECDGVHLALDAGLPSWRVTWEGVHEHRVPVVDVRLR